MRLKIGCGVRAIAPFCRAYLAGGLVPVWMGDHRILVRTRRLVNRRFRVTRLPQLDRIRTGRSVATVMLADRRLGSVIHPQAHLIAFAGLTTAGLCLLIRSFSGFVYRRVALVDYGSIARIAVLIRSTLVHIRFPLRFCVDFNQR